MNNLTSQQKHYILPGVQYLSHMSASGNFYNITLLLYSSTVWNLSSISPLLKIMCLEKVPDNSKLTFQLKNKIDYQNILRVLTLQAL